MPWKMNGDHIALDAGNPVWEDSDGQTAINPESQFSEITKLRSESAKRRVDNRELTEKLANAIKADAESRTALDGLKAANTKTAEGVEQIEARIKASYDRKIAEWEEKFNKQQTDINDMTIRSAFDSSAWLSRNTNITPDMAFARWKGHFSVEKTGDNGSLSAFLVEDGEKVFSSDPKKIGQHMSTDEAIERLINQHPNKEQLLKSTPGGSGAPGGAGPRDVSGIAVLQKQYDAALKAGDVPAQIAVKNRLAELSQ